MLDWVNMRRSPRTLTGDTFCRAVTESKPYAWPNLHVSGGDAREMQARTHVIYIPMQHLEVRELERSFELLEELVADVAAPYGTQRVVGRKWNLR